uniref:Hexosyltransferase n=1 Tax=Steinernema glaseri TaxID=37863 RepID=A0A1I7YGN9_9BILA
MHKHDHSFPPCPASIAGDLKEEREKGRSRESLQIPSVDNRISSAKNEEGPTTICTYDKFRFKGQIAFSLSARSLLICARNRVGLIDFADHRGISVCKNSFRLALVTTDKMEGDVLLWTVTHTTSKHPYGYSDMGRNHREFQYKVARFGERWVIEESGNNKQTCGFVVPMKFGRSWRNFWKYGAALSILLITFDIALWTRSPSQAVPDLEVVTRIFDAFSLPNLKDEPSGQFLSEDWTEDVAARPLFRGEVPRCGKGVDLLVGVISKADKQKERAKVRESWASKSNHNASFTRIVFFIGDDKNADHSDERRRFQDVVHVSVGESYYNLSVKTYALLRYQREFCPHAKCVVKIDSDVVANIAGIEELCRRQNDTPLVTGHCHDDWLPLQREVSSKFYVPHYIYSYDLYPPYCYGAAYMFTGREVVPLLLQALHRSPFFRSENFRRLSEDVIFTGLLRSYAQMPLRNNFGFSVYQEDYSYWCPRRRSPTPLIYHGSKEPLEEWRRMKKMLNGSIALLSYDRWTKCGLRGTMLSSAE